MSINETEHKDASEYGFPKPPEGHYWRIDPGMVSGYRMELAIRLVERRGTLSEVVEYRETAPFPSDDLVAAKAAAVHAMHSMLSVVSSPVWDLEGVFE